ncbi:hypothetical protein AAZX31_16G095000 [Glycine max]|uniref:S-protein homolog n=2 Tax=Glycine subgen. Soja TaxID=1462606 RepID=K7MGD6_SOYBN|nr:hypothetical protein JHK86_045052 [Glycine max]KHN47649.1 hypothetical protein glysoja_040395 [Glycine soja]KAG4951753.1 hypothetical protein JHK85_045620 [Glycine max]KAG5099601.1 hypothetical protein JHK82_044653 [Glycine max]KAG5108201.1 hypothetical protein JHK84_045108 [Glycine max]
MALIKERSVDKAIANIPTNTLVKIILTLMLFSHVINAWNIGCLGARKYNLFFENRMADDIPGYDMQKNELQIKCDYSRARWLTLSPNGSITRCGGWFWDPTIACYLRLTNSTNSDINSIWRHIFVAFKDDDKAYACKKEKECRWQIRKYNIYLYSPAENRYIKRDYLDDACRKSLKACFLGPGN